MKDRRLYCEHHWNTNRRKALKIHLSDGTCDVYGCPGYANEYGNEWTIYTPPERGKKKGSRSPASRLGRSENISVFKFFSDSIAKSSINGISNCFSASSIFGKFLWLIVFCACVIGFSYQTSHFYRLYRSKPSVVQIEVENDGEVDFPAVTVCNTNRIRRSTYCKHFRERCNAIIGSETLSEKEINKLLYQLLLDRKQDIKKDLGHNMTMFEECDFIGVPVLHNDSCKALWEDFYDPDFGNCYTFTSLTEENIPLQARKVDFWQEENDLTLVMDAEPEEFMERKRTVGIRLVIHDGKAYPDIHTEGLLLEPGHSYTITVAKSTVILLPPPYKTNCTFYPALPWQSKYKRRLTSRMCTVGCSQYHQNLTCGYVTPDLSLFYEELPYLKEQITNETIKCAEAEESRTVDYCRSICGLPCRDTAFSVSTTTAKLSAKELGPKLANRAGHYNMSIFDDIVHVRIFYSTLEHKIFRHIPKYDTMELFSFLGGYSGVWLGFSLLTVYELLDIMVRTVIFLIRKIINKRRNRRFVRAIVNSRKHAKIAVKTYKNKHYYG